MKRGPPGVMRTRSFNYEFDELPLVLSAGLEAGHVAGIAELAYDQSGAWSILRIGLDAVKRLTPTLDEHIAAKRLGRPVKFFERSTMWLDAGDPLQLLIYHRLEHDWRKQVQDRVADRIFEDRNDAGDAVADHRAALENERV